jgi:hypothetical protein
MLGRRCRGSNPVISFTRQNGVAEVKIHIRCGSNVRDIFPASGTERIARLDGVSLPGCGIEGETYLVIRDLNLGENQGSWNNLINVTTRKIAKVLFSRGILAKG